jgi:acetyl-CoA C-acetyltransferase
MDNRPVYVVGGIRTPFVKSFTVYNDVKEQDLMTASLTALIGKYSLQEQIMGDTAIGATIRSALGWDFGRECVLGSGLSPYSPGYAIQRACGSSLETTLQIAHKIASNQIESGITGGIDTNSDLPIEAPYSLSHKLLKLRGAKTALDKAKIFLSLRPADLK